MRLEARRPCTKPAPAPAREADATGAPALSVRDLRKTYANGVAALHGVSLDVPARDFFALLGPNGAGKSTLIGIIASLVTFRDGAVEVFGHDIVRAYARARQRIGLVPQEFNFNRFMPVAEIVASQGGYYGMPYAAARASTRRLLQRFGLWARRDAEAGDLSGGMKRRLMLARALVHGPKLLILDEPTAGVDLQTRRHLWDYLEEINAAGTTIILTTHYLEEAERLCRNIAIINHGGICVHAAMAEVLARLDTEELLLFAQEPLPAELSVPGYALRRIDARTLEAAIEKDRGVGPLLAALEERGVRILGVRNKSNRLETLFLQLVGEKFEDS